DLPAGLIPEREANEALAIERRLARLIEDLEIGVRCLRGLSQRPLGANRAPFEAQDERRGFDRNQLLHPASFEVGISRDDRRIGENREHVATRAASRLEAFFEEGPPIESARKILVERQRASAGGSIVAEKGPAFHRGRLAT